jgi:hypothetical protein
MVQVSAMARLVQALELLGRQQGQRCFLILGTDWSRLHLRRGSHCRVDTIGSYQCYQSWKHNWHSYQKDCMPMQT